MVGSRMPIATRALWVSFQSIVVFIGNASTLVIVRLRAARRVRAPGVCTGFHFNREAMVVTLYLGGFYTAQFLALSRHCQAPFAEASSR